MRRRSSDTVGHVAADCQLSLRRSYSPIGMHGGHHLIIAET